MPRKNEKQGVIRGNPARTRELILDAALAEFAENGLGGGRIDVIARNAHVNKQALYYHFVNKDGLYKATIEYGYALVRSSDDAGSDDHLSPPERLTSLISRYFDTINKHQEVVALVAEENRLRGRHLNDSHFVMDINAPFVDRVRTIYEDGAAAGVFREGIDSSQLWITIVSISQFFFSNAYTLSHILKTDMKAQAMVAKRKKHIVDFLLAALRP